MFFKAEKNGEIQSVDPNRIAKESNEQSTGGKAKK